MSKELIVSATAHETKVAIIEDDQVVEVYFEREQEYSLAGSIFKGRVTRVLPGMQSAFVHIGLERDAFLYVSDFFEDTEEYDALVSATEEKVARLERDGRLDTLEPAAAPAALSASASAAPSLAGQSPDWVVTETPPVELPTDAAASAGDAVARPVGPSGRDEQPGDETRGGLRLDGGDRDRHHRRNRRRRGKHRGGFPESKYAGGGGAPRPAPPVAAVPPSVPSAEAAEVREEEAAPAPIILPGESLAKYRGLSNAANKSEVVILQEAPGPAEPPLGPPEAVVPAVLAAEPVVEPPVVTVAEPVVVGLAEPASEVVMEEIASDEAGLAEALAAGETAANLSEEAGEDGPEGESAEVNQDADQDPDSAPKADAVATVRGPAPERRFQSRRNRRRGRDQRQQPNQNRPSPPRQGSSPQNEPGSSAGERDSRPTRGQPLIGELLHEGQEIIVQIAKEPIGKKGARITSHIALPGRYLVYMPTVDHVGVSRRISSDEERQRLKRVLTEFRRGVNMPGGFIVRTAAEGHSDEDLRADMRFLFNLWKECRSQAEKKSAPLLLHRDLNLVERILRDQVSSNFTTIWVDDEAQYAKIVEFANLSQPSLAGRVKLYGKETPIFEEFGVQEQINNAMKSKVWLKSGGYIVINQTEALVAIDVNTGKYVGKTQRLEDTIVKTNVDAIKEIVRQIRLRDLGGIIVIDFIDMDERKNRQRVMQALEEALRKDRAPSKALQFNDFGLVAITRKRVKQPLEKALGCACPYCTGSGFVKSAQTVSLEILAEARKMILSGAIERNTITLRVNPEVARYMKQTGAAIIAEIEELAKKPLIVKGDINLHQENFDIH
jgi:Rne/Rng family ribonuclease